MSDDARPTRDDLAFNPFDPVADPAHVGSHGATACGVPGVPTHGRLRLHGDDADTAATFKDAKRFSSAEGFRARALSSPTRRASSARSTRRCTRGPSPAAPRVHAPAPRPRSSRSRVRAHRPSCSMPIARDGGGDLMAGAVHRAAGRGVGPRAGHPATSTHDRGRGLVPRAAAQHVAGDERDRAGRGHRRRLPRVRRASSTRRSGAGATRRDPPDDLLTRMVQAEDDGDRLTDLHIRTLAVNTLAGSLSTTYMLGNLLYRFAADPAFADDAPGRPRRSFPKPSRSRCGSSRRCCSCSARRRRTTTIGDTPGARGRARHHRHRVGEPRRAGVRVPGRVPARPRDREGDAPDHLTFGVGPAHLPRHPRGADGGPGGARDDARPLRARRRSRLADDYELQLRARCSSSTAPRRWT